MTDFHRPLPAGLEPVRVLGEGGFGEVVLARQTALGRLVAVKRIHAAGLAAPDEVRRFAREAQVLARLDHPTVVRVLDFRREDGDALLVMEFVDGVPLSDLIGGLEVPQALEILSDVATALTVAAEQGIVHRDIKPANVFVSPQMRAKLGDFGLARIAADPELFRTTDGGVRGTPAYMAPEVALIGHEPDARSDAYSFAVLAFEVLTGRLPFTATDPLALLAAHDSLPPPLASSVVPGMPAAVDRVLAAGLAKDPAARPGPAELVAALRDVPPAAWPARAAAAAAGAPATVVTAADASPAAAAPPAPATVVRSSGTPTGGPPRSTAAPDVVADLLRTPNRRPRRRRRRSLRLLIPVLAAVVGLALVAGWLLLRSPDPAATAALGVTGVEWAITPADGVGSCPEANYRVTATLSTNGGEGQVRPEWLLPDGRRQAVEPVAVAAGQGTVVLSVDFQLTGTVPVDRPTTLVLEAPGRMEVTGPAVRYGC